MGSEPATGERVPGHLFSVTSLRTKDRTKTGAGEDAVIFQELSHVALRCLPKQLVWH